MVDGRWTSGGDSHTKTIYHPPYTIYDIPCTTPPFHLPLDKPEFLPYFCPVPPSTSRYPRKDASSVSLQTAIRMRGFVLFTAFLFVHFATQAQDDPLFRRHDPKEDPNINPFINYQINPDSNLSINPSVNWNLNPLKDNQANPMQNSAINPMTNLQLNPQSNEVLNPVFMKSLQPSNRAWNGLFIFNDSNNLFGYISVATQNVMISFDNKGTWNGYFVRAGRQTYNYFTVPGIWTGMYLCHDNSSGYNLFDKNGKWTGIHVK